MATRIFEMDDYQVGGGYTHLAVMPWKAKQSITASGASQQSSAFGADTGVVVVQSDEAVHVVAGSNPTATTDDYKIPAGGEAQFRVNAGDKLAVRTA